jgi:hypothetical protein
VILFPCQCYHVPVCICMSIVNVQDFFKENHVSRHDTPNRNRNLKQEMMVKIQEKK